MIVAPTPNDGGMGVPPMIGQRLAGHGQDARATIAGSSFLRTAHGLLLSLSLLAFVMLTGCATLPDDPPRHVGVDARELRSETGISVETRVISYPSSAGIHSGFLCVPVRDEPLPAIVVIHEWWGLNEHVKSEARRLASLGYVVLAVDLYQGEVAADRERAQALRSAVKDDVGLKTLRGAVRYLQSMPETRDRFVGCLGWCYGGMWSLRLAMADPAIRACVVYYGTPEVNPNRLESINGAVLGIFGDQDRVIPVEQVEAFDRGLESAGIPHTVRLFPGVGHAFANPTNKDGYRSDEAAEARRMVERFLASQLGMGLSTNQWTADDERALP